MDGSINNDGTTPSEDSTCVGSEYDALRRSRPNGNLGVELDYPASLVIRRSRFMLGSITTLKSTPVYLISTRS
jgi:hypothetical protein